MQLLRDNLTLWTSDTNVSHLLSHGALLSMWPWLSLPIITSHGSHVTLVLPFFPPLVRRMAATRSRKLLPRKSPQRVSKMDFDLPTWCICWCWERGDQDRCAWILIAYLLVYLVVVVFRHHTHRCMHAMELLPLLLFLIKHSRCRHAARFVVSVFSSR
jgi:hypothetical protein